MIIRKPFPPEKRRSTSIYRIARVIRSIEVKVNSLAVTANNIGPDQLASSYVRKLSFCSHPPWKKWVREILAQLATPPVLVTSLTGTPSSTAHARSTCTAAVTIALTGWAPPVNREQQSDGSTKPIAYIHQPSYARLGGALDSYIEVSSAGSV